MKSMVNILNLTTNTVNLFEKLDEFGRGDNFLLLFLEIIILLNVFLILIVFSLIPTYGPCL